MLLEGCTTMRYELPEGEDEDEAYERIRQSDIDDGVAHKLAVAQAQRATGAGRDKAGLVDRIGSGHKDSQRREAGRIKEGTDAS